MNVVLVGTSIFISKSKAYKYYKNYNLTSRDVDCMEKRGEISFGKDALMKKYPDCDYMIDSDGRYFVKVTCEGDKPYKLSKKE